MNDRIALTDEQRKEMDATLALRAVAEELLKYDYTGDAVIIISVENADIEEVEGVGYRISGDLRIAQSATNHEAATYCAVIRDSILDSGIGDAVNDYTEVGWD